MSAPVVFSSLAEVTAAVGRTLGPTEWLVVHQDRVSAFADATNDHQWIHVDPGRAADSRFGTTVAHGYLTLALIPWFGAQLFRIDYGSARLNYGTDRVRFPAPVRTGAPLRARVTIRDVSPKAGGTLITAGYVLEVDGAERPACSADTLVLILP